MKFTFVIKGEIEANSLDDAKDWIKEGLTLDVPISYWYDSIYEEKEMFEKCSVITVSGRQCLNHKRFGDYCGIHIKLNLNKKQNGKKEEI